MKRIVLLLLAGALVLAMPKPAFAQACATTSNLCDLRAQIEDHLRCTAAGGSSIYSLCDLQDHLFNKIDLRKEDLRANINASLHDLEVDLKDFATLSSGESLKNRIEEALRTKHRLAGFYLPEALGGHQALVRQIVADTIASVQASGEPVNQAQNNLGYADGDIAAGRHKRAFTFLATAYFEATKNPGETQ